MSTIKVIDSLLLDKDGLKCKGKGKGGKDQKVHLRQGDMDGACSIYSLMMNLIIIGAIKYNEVRNRQEFDKRTSKGRLFKDFLDRNGLYRNGSSFDKVTDDLLHSFKSQIANAEYHDMINEESVRFITENIEKHKPLVISIEYNPKEAHALVAIGIEKSGENVTKIFCLDPGEDSPINTYWNGVIDLTPQRSKYPYKYITESQTNKVKLSDIIEITEK